MSLRSQPAVSPSGYVIALTVDDFLSLTRTEPYLAPYVHLQRQLTISREVYPTLTSLIVLTAQSIDNSLGRPILAARVRVEQVGSNGRDVAPLLTQMHARLDRIMELLRQEIVDIGFMARPGMILMPGLYDDLDKTLADHGSRWRIDQLEERDPTSRVLTLPREAR